MGSEFLSEEEPQTEDAPPSYTEQFYTAYPFYFELGMTYRQFWYEDCTLVKYFRRYYREKMQREQEHENYNAWLQGAYVYDAICAVSPVLHAFAKKGTKVQPYLKAPYPMQGSTEKKKQKAEQINPLQTKFVNMAARFNAQFKAKGGEASADD